MEAALHRLRDILGRKDAVTVANGKLRLNPTVCWIDTSSLDADGAEEA